MRTAILIPARDESDALPTVLESLVEVGIGTDAVVVVDNGSSDGTGEIARTLGVNVVEEPRPGYGRACLAGMAWLRASRRPDTLVFLDADDFSAPDQLGSLIDPIAAGAADLVIGERRSVGSGGVRLHAKLGNQLVLTALRVLYGSSVRDMGPFRAIRWSALESLALDDTNYGWYVQMQVRALRAGFRVRGVPVDFERRTVGTSKVSGSAIGSARAGWVMLRTLAVETMRPRVSPERR